MLSAGDTVLGAYLALTQPSRQLPETDTPLNLEFSEEPRLPTKAHSRAGAWSLAQACALDPHLLLCLQFVCQSGRLGADRETKPGWDNHQTDF